MTSSLGLLLPSFKKEWGIDETKRKFLNSVVPVEVIKNSTSSHGWMMFHNIYEGDGGACTAEGTFYKENESYSGITGDIPTQTRVPVSSTKIYPKYFSPPSGYYKNIGSGHVFLILRSIRKSFSVGYNQTSYDTYLVGSSGLSPCGPQHPKFWEPLGPFREINNSVYFLGEPIGFINPSVLLDHELYGKFLPPDLRAKCFPTND